MKKGGFWQRLGAITYMQSSLGAFVLGLTILLALFWRAVSTAGGLKSWEGILGILGLLISLLGFLLPLYGKFVVRSKDKPDYRLGLLLNGCLFLVYLFFYFLGV